MATFYVLVGLSAVVAALFVAVIVLLYDAVQTIIRRLAPGPGP